MRGRTAAVLAGAVLLVGAVVLLVQPRRDHGQGASAQTDVEFRRRLRLGVDQLRRHLLESARAELDACARLRPDDPELLFHRARLALTAEGEGPSRARELLVRMLEHEPRSLAAKRLLLEIDLLANGGAPTARQRAEIVRDHGQIGAVELDWLMGFLRSGDPGDLRLPAPRPGLPHEDDYRALRDAFVRLMRTGRFAPSEAVPILERVLRTHPDLAAVRLQYARLILLTEIRVNYSDRPGLPPMSSKLTLDMAQSHLERAFDVSHPGSPLATEVLIALGQVAMQMGDYEESFVLREIVRQNRSIPDARRRELTARMGLARHKQGRQAEAIALLLEALSGSRNLVHLWLLHQAYEAAGTPLEERARPFRFRSDLAGPGEGGPLAFVDRAAEVGVDKLDGLGPSAWGDYDGDGDFDLFVSGCDSYGVLLRNDGDRHTDVSRGAGLFHVQSGYSATFADYDGDGRPDLHVGRDGWNGPAPNSLYRNRGDGTFADVTDGARVGDPGDSFVHAWSDVDRDGDLDLYVANGITGSGATNALYGNEGDGTFADATARAGLREAVGTRTIGLAFGDYDDDGWPDLFVSGYETLNRLYRNRGDGTFEERAAEAGVDGARHRSRGYVAFFLDYDGDLDLDILRTNLAPWGEVLRGLSERFDGFDAAERSRLARLSPKLYRNEGDGTFEEVSEEAGLVHPIGTMGAGVADLDNDGWLDLYLGTGDPDVGRLEPDRFLRNRGDGTFVDLTFATGLGNVGKGHGITFVDHDGDGDLEIYAPEGGFVHGDPWRNAFYRNDQRSGHHWLHVDLEGTVSNRDAVGARIVVEAGGLRILRQVANGEGFGSSSSPTVELGLGGAARIDRLEIRWPSGLEQVFDDVPVDTRIRVREGEPWRGWSER